jgi:trehalose 2-sulfotransferase
MRNFRSTPPLTDAVFDLPPCETSKFNYMIASTPRAGGTYLSNVLWETGVLGCPAEYFNFKKTMFRLSARLGTETPAAYLKAIVRIRTTANGVFGFKAHYDHLQFMLLAGLFRHLGDFKIIRMTRNDPVAEAVSLSRAIQTEEWTSKHPKARRSPVYNVENLNRCTVIQREQKQGWLNFLDKYGFDYMTIEYNELRTNPVGVAMRVIQSLGYPTSPKQKLDLPKMTQQADSHSAEWITRYLADPGHIDI